MKEIIKKSMLIVCSGVVLLTVVGCSNEIDVDKSRNDTNVSIKINKDEDKSKKSDKKITNKVHGSKEYISATIENGDVEID